MSRQPPRTEVVESRPRMNGVHSADMATRTRRSARRDPCQVGTVTVHIGTLGCPVLGNVSGVLSVSEAPPGKGMDVLFITEMTLRTGNFRYAASKVTAMALRAGFDVGGCCLAVGQGEPVSRMFAAVGIQIGLGIRITTARQGQNAQRQQQSKHQRRFSYL